MMMPMTSKLTAWRIRSAVVRMGNPLWFRAVPSAEPLVGEVVLAWLWI